MNTVGGNSVMRTKTAESAGLGCVMKNIEAVTNLCDMLRSSYGANGMYKLVVNAQKKSTISRSTSSILAGCEIEHPALRMLIEPIAHLAQMGDCTGFFVGVLGEILKESSKFINQGMLPTEISSALRDMVSEMGATVTDISEKVEFSLEDKEVLYKIASGIVKSEYISKMLAECISSISKNGSFPIDSIRVAKVETGFVSDSERIQGMLLESFPCGSIRSGKSLKTAIYTCPLAMSNMETKGTVLFRNAEELLAYTNEDEKGARMFVDSLTENGIGLLICSGSVDPLLLDFLNEKKVIVITIHSKFDLRRLCMLFGGRFSHVLRPMESSSLGLCSSLEICTYGERPYMKITGPGSVNTLLLRGSLGARLEELERVILRATYALQVCSNESMRTGSLRLLQGAGKFEEVLAKVTLEKSAEYTDNRRICSEIFSKAVRTIGERIEKTEDFVYDIAPIKEKALEYALILAADILSVTQMFITKNEDTLKAPKRPGHWDDVD
ncbi:T-complex protein 1 subunit theta [Nematocida sp. LUAm3]|nr:T-complex protein 1 subunit theta [Nematocida sp. LUAm3]KAI5176079.1 T-complex protein 1 subunit theta [Nematocida sp. LUAm2]KAI5177123.1 T-complex protein 1 subunit theta [Nematocida sp. LUAm1]